MAWVGVIEALVAGAVGLWLRHALPSADRNWSWGLWGAGFVVLVLSLGLAAAEGRRESLAAGRPAAAVLPVAVPPPAVTAYPAELAGMWRDVIQAHLDAGALNAAASQAVAARAILDGGAGGSAAALFEAHLLRDGYRMWAHGQELLPDVEGYRDVVDPEQAADRRAALAAERERLAAEWASWHEDRPDGGSVAERLEGAEARERQLAELLRRAEELGLLSRGYDALRAARDGQDGPGKEG